MNAKHNYITVVRRSIFAVGFACSIGISSSAFSQAVLNPNQISGKVSFTNTNTEILNVLSPSGLDQGFDYLYIRADSIGITPALNNYAYPQATSATQSSYQLTVESSASGIPYKVSAEVRLGNRQDRYIIDPVESAKVYPEPAADVALNIDQCVSMLDIKFVDTNGVPVALNGGSATAHQEYTMYDRPYYKLQAQSFSFPNGTTREFLAVNGNAAKYRLDVIMESGADPSSNLVRGLCRKELTPRCDEVVPVTCVIGGTMDLGQIAGAVDVLGEEELDVSYFTRMRAFNGPLNNYRYDHVAGSGDFLMQNMVPSDSETPAKNYMVYGEIAFGTGFRTQFLRTPWLGLSTYNPAVAVEGGKTTDLGNTFVLDPGYVSGLVVLAGPPASDGESFLHDLNRNMSVDYNKDGVIDYINQYSSHVEAQGQYLVAEGATMSASGGNAKAGFGGAYDAEISSFVGDYRIALGGLKGETSIWRPNMIGLQFMDSNPVNLQDYRYSYLTISDNNVSNQVIAPGSSKRIDHTYCMNDVVLAYKSLSGTFYNPLALAKGTFVGTDFLGNAANQSMYLQYAYGIPRQQSLAANHGLVNLALPQGSYEVTPKVTAINPDGSTSYTELPPVSFDVACRQAVTLTTDLQLSTDELPLNTDQAETTVSGSINSLGNVVVIKYVHNQSPEVVVCENCGVNPTYTFNVSLTDGENKIVVSAEDEYGDVSTSTSFVTYKPVIVPEPDPVVPLSIVGCSNKSVVVGAYETSAKVDFDVKTEGGCGTPTLSCDAQSGDVFSLGETNVSCKAIDSCGTEKLCQFSVKVEAEVAEEKEPVCGDEEDEAYTVSSVVSINQLWPPNHKFKDVGLIVTDDDPCAESTENTVSNTVTTVWSDEPELAQDGSGNFAPDAKDMDADINLRAERSGKGDGRVYLLISKGTSSSGSDAFSCLVVTVPHSMSAKSIAAVTSEAEEAKAYCEANNGSAPPEFYQNGFEHRSAKEANDERAARIKGAEKIADARKAKEAKKLALSAARDAARAEAEKAAALQKAKEDAARAAKEVEAKKAALARDEAKRAAAQKAAALLKAKEDSARAVKEAEAKKAALARYDAKKVEAKRSLALLKAKDATVKAEEAADAQKVALNRKSASETAAILRAIETVRAYSVGKALTGKAPALTAQVSTSQAKVKSEAFNEKDVPSSVAEKLTAAEDDVVVSADAEAEAVVEEDVVSADEELQDVFEDVVNTDEELEVLVDEDANAEETEAVVEEDAASAEEETEEEEEEVAEEETESTVPQEIVSLNEVK